MRHARSLVAVLAVSSLVVMALVTDPAAARSKIAKAPPGCNFSNYFAYTPAALTSCGLDVWPLTNTQALPGGGEAYSYDEGSNGVVTELVPPPASIRFTRALSSSMNTDFRRAPLIRKALLTGIVV